MNVLVVHNRYREAGGEDRVFENETGLLARYGHKVISYLDDNARIEGTNPVALAASTVWNHTTYRRIRRMLADTRPDVVHVHNTLALVSPSVYYAAAAEGVPVVQTLHNYRLLCPNAVCYRDDNPCTACVGLSFATPAVRHACYRGSRAATATVAAMLWMHRTAGTWRNRIAVYIAPSDFARRMFVDGGVPADRIVVKPHFVDPDPGIGSGNGGYAIFVGRLAPEKGIETLLSAWSRLHTRLPLLVVGDGPQSTLVRDAAQRMQGIAWLGRQDPSEVQRLVGSASLLVFPSVVYETFGQVIAEAYAAGTPVVASDQGAGAELVTHRDTGLLARRGDAADLAAQIDWWLAHPEAHAAMRARARQQYESRFTASANHAALMDIYARAIKTEGPAKAEAEGPPEAGHCVLNQPSAVDGPGFNRTLDASQELLP